MSRSLIPAREVLKKSLCQDVIQLIERYVSPPQLYFLAGDRANLNSPQAFVYEGHTSGPLGSPRTSGPRWHPYESLSISRTATSMIGIDGSVVVCGGRQDYCYQCIDELCCRPCGQQVRRQTIGPGEVWEVLPPLNRFRRHAAIEKIGSTLFVFGGSSKPQCEFLRRPEASSTQPSRWELTSQMWWSSTRVISSVLKDQIYVWGQYSSSRYDPAVDRWLTVPNLDRSDQSSYHPYAAAGWAEAGSLYRCGGLSVTSRTDLQETARWDPRENDHDSRWDLRAPLLSKRQNHQVVQFRGKTWALGGISSLHPLGQLSIERYDSAADVWTMEDLCLPVLCKEYGLAVL